jgi:hypothetical protein
MPRNPRKPGSRGNAAGNSKRDLNGSCRARLPAVSLEIPGWPLHGGLHRGQRYPQMASGLAVYRRKREMKGEGFPCRNFCWVY